MACGEKEARLDGEMRCRGRKNMDSEGERTALEKITIGVDDICQRNDSAEFV